MWPGHEAPAEEIGRVETWKSHEISLYFLHMNMNYYYCCYCYLSLLLYVIVIIIITVIMHNVYFICYCLLSLLLSLLLYIYIDRDAQIIRDIQLLNHAIFQRERYGTYKYIYI